ncbi:putative polysaccharide biosynthesis protein [Bacilliculturomica massiliensis]|uniref:putative polysaccharide biosynthesis protein n=1 Tax=Bacilliculturomica massiliensis TaxID=1917867 RepID=UPI00102FD1DB|nr:polysaccharide biosynthesis protein [Bacilliculturomica massiliensis]
MGANETREVKKKSFLQGAAILAGAAVLIKLMGAFFRIPLANIIGAVGMGYYQTAYPIYNLFLTISTAGIPVAISRMVAERCAEGNHYEAHRVFKVSFLLLLIIGTLSSSILYFGADAYAKSANMDEAVLAIRAIAPALLLVSLMAAFRGYFQGTQNMKPTACSQIFEQLFRVAVGLTLAIVLAKKGLEVAAAGASFGATAGSAFGLLVIALIYLLHKKAIAQKIRRSGSKSSGESSGRILVRIFIIALPITIGAAIMPLMNMIDLQIVMNRLVDIGYTSESAQAMYGELSGFAAPLINLPQVLIQAIAISLVPTIAAAHQRRDMEFLRFNVSTGLRTAMIIAMPCAFGMMTLSEPIMLLLYPLEKASAVSAAPLLFILALGIIFLSGIQTLTGILQGIGKQNIPVRNLFIGALVKVACTFYLTGVESINVKGAAIGTVATYIVTFLLNLAAVKKYTKADFSAGQVFLRPLISVLAMSVCAWGAHRLIVGVLGNSLATLLAVAVGGIVYIVMIFATKTITPQELSMLPKGDKIAKLAGKFGK